MPAAKKPAKATTSKSTAKKSPAKTVKKSTARKSPRAKTSKATQQKSFRVQQENEQFMTFKLTRQTIYWLILGVIVLAQGIWTININQQVQQIYDEIDQSNLQQQQLDDKEIEMMREQKVNDK